MKKLLFFCCILLAYCHSVAQNHKGFKWVSPNNKFYEIDVKNLLLIQSNAAANQVVLQKLNCKQETLKDLPKDYSVFAFYKDNYFLLSIPGTGQVYKLNIKDFTLERLDDTFFRGFNFDAHQFVRNDTIFSVGGSGFWMKHNLITYYNFKTKEWDLLQAKNQNIFSVSDKFSGYSVENDAFFSAFLETDTILQASNLFFHVFDFKSKTWLNKGSVSPIIQNFARLRLWTVWTGKYLICSNGAIKNEILLVDPFNNKLYSYDSGQDKFFFTNSYIYHNNGMVYSRQFNNTTAGEKYILDSLPLKKIINGSKYIGNVYENELSTSYKLALTFGLLLLIGLIIYFRKSKKPLIHLLNEQEIDLLKVCLKLSMGSSISSIEINAILKIDAKSYDNQRQIRNRIISSINTKLANYFGAEELIKRAQDVDDKRIMNYYLNPEIKNLNKIKDHFFKC